MLLRLSAVDTYYGQIHILTVDDKVIVKMLSIHGGILEHGAPIGGACAVCSEDVLRIHAVGSTGFAVAAQEWPAAFVHHKPGTINQHCVDGVRADQVEICLFGVQQKKLAIDRSDARRSLESGYHMG